ncbi:helix-turn-helix transcriptional regulator [Spongiactinospora sp. TRM90649]|uniref:helix-turn-helix domain-containing protein n=1 Tax=Spongiactinospora sp. TRM90649 TaxID=3031114 RepID=UPI0023F8CD4B|nr:helix-turn-helix transcriptional regulator [Spongiactinospora sp. TRM90649]MDF5751279.1 helix-turn-helix transcriptional regulator [Spongiactinospora sp. TRM90649]
MARGKHIPTVASTRLAGELRAQRDAAGLSQEAVAEEMGWAESKLYRIENDKSRVLQRDVKRLLKLYGTGTKQVDAIIELARRASEPDWWHQYSSAIPDYFQVYVVLEASASHVHGYESELVPGIMQTERYARAIISTTSTAEPDDEIDDMVKLRTSREVRLKERNPLQVWFVLNEAVIRRVVGGPEVMREQIEHLIQFARLRNVTLQVLPFKSGEHGAMSGSFYLLKFPAAGDPDKVYVEQHLGGLYTQKTHDVEWYSLRFDHLRARALGPAETIAMLRAVAAELT